VKELPAPPRTAANIRPTAPVGFTSASAIGRSGTVFSFTFLLPACERHARSADRRLEVQVCRDPLDKSLQGRDVEERPGYAVTCALFPLRSVAVSTRAIRAAARCCTAPMPHRGAQASYCVVKRPRKPVISPCMAYLAIENLSVSYGASRVLDH